MSIERYGDTYIPTCDYCGAELSAEYDFYDAVDAKKLAGWKSLKDGTVWGDCCLTCHKEMNGAAADFMGV